MDSDNREISDRRTGDDRRRNFERRVDRRNERQSSSRLLKSKLMSFLRPRMGVDRRKGERRQRLRRTQRSILTQDEIRDLLS